MCEIAVMVTGIVHDDPVLDTKMFKRGDVISILPDGADWGDLAMTNPNFRMIRLTGVSVSEASVLLAPEVDDNPEHPNRMLRQRMHRFNLSHPNLPQAALDFLSDDNRTIKVFEVPQGLARRLVAERIVLKPIPNPDVIG